VAMAVEAADVAPFHDRLDALTTEAESLVAHASERARLRSKEGRPAFSTTTEQSLRTIRAAIDSLLEPADPAPSEDAPPERVDPAPVAPEAPAAPVTPRFRSREDWLRYLEAQH